MRNSCMAQNIVLWALGRYHLFIIQHFQPRQRNKTQSSTWWMDGIDRSLLSKYAFSSMQQIMYCLLFTIRFFLRSLYWLAGRFATKLERMRNNFLRIDDFQTKPVSQSVSRAHRRTDGRSVNRLAKLPAINHLKLWNEN